METLKTREVADKLGVSQKTVRHWINHFSLKCQTNNLGHYLIDEKVMADLSTIQRKVRAGTKLEEVSLSHHDKEKRITQTMVPSHQLDERFNKLIFQIDQLDKKIQTKASEVVEIQMLQHRKEIDEMNEAMERFEARLTKLEEILREEARKLAVLEQSRNKVETVKKSRLANMFSF